jgi:putative heme-binding domain-containing protein
MLPHAWRRRTFFNQCRALLGLLVIGVATPVPAQTLQERLAAESAGALANSAETDGDPQRGAILFHQAYLGCAKCHNQSVATSTDSAGTALGPDLTRIGRNKSTTELVDSVLRPSKVIKQGFETLRIELKDGRVVVGLFASEGEKQLVLRSSSDGGTIVFDKSAIEAQRTDAASTMPAELVNQLASRQQFLDLVRYLVEIRDGGPERARQLQPAPSLVAGQLPEYEARVDHAGMIRDLDAKAFHRGKAIYERLCANCHGTHQQEGSLPTALRFATGKFKNGSDPYAMYQTLTRGFGFMAPQTWMVPRQKYDVIHYLREAYLKGHNPSQYAPLGAEYLASLPPGDTQGPAPRTMEPWVTMDYGPSLINTYEIGSDGANFAYKGIAVRLDPGPGGVSRGKAWMVFDHDTLRVAAAWTGTGFIDWNGIHFNGRHQVHPRVVGKVLLSNPTGPGWANPETENCLGARRPPVWSPAAEMGQVPRSLSLWRSGGDFLYRGSNGCPGNAGDGAPAVEVSDESGAGR